MQKYFIFVFNEKFYEDESYLGKIFKFPEPDKGGQKFKNRSKGSWGPIKNIININDKVIWMISGASTREDKKTIWGYGKIIEINQEKNFWKLESHEYEKKVRLEDVVSEFPNEYQKLYKFYHSKMGVFYSAGFFGTNQIDKFQYDFITNFCIISQN